MRARSTLVGWDRFTGRPLADLQQISYDLDLIDGSDGDVRAGNQALERLARPFMASKGITDMATTKVLHLLRPRFVAISDNMRTSLGLEETETEEHV